MIEEKVEKKIKYQRNSKPVEIKFQVALFQNGDIDVSDKFTEIAEGVVISSESFTFIKPWFSLHQFIKSVSLTSSQLLGVSLNPAILENIRLQYLVKSCSVVNLEKGLDSQGFEYITNFDDIVEENGLHENIIRYMVRKMYEILGA